MIPGYGGNQIWAKLNKTSSAHEFCVTKTNDYFELWLNLLELTPMFIDCLIENLKLVYNKETRATLNNDGVDILVKNFGSTDTLEYFDDSRLSFTSYFSNLVDALVKKANYVRNKNIRGAPYDWRKAPDELNEFYVNLTHLCEQTYELNNKTKLILIAHSMGNPVVLYWLNNYVDKLWKSKYIKYFVSISSPWGGSIKVLRMMASGDDLSTGFLRPLTLRAYQRSAAATHFLLPSYLFWQKDEILISRPGQNYTVFDYDMFFKDLNFTDGFELFKKTVHLLNDLQAPQVELHSLYGVGVKTPTSFFYKKHSEWPDSQPHVMYGDGDGTVNLRSLLGYQRWSDKQKESIYFREFKGVEHLETISHPDVIQYILDLINL